MELLADFLVRWGGLAGVSRHVFEYLGEGVTDALRALTQDDELQFLDAIELAGWTEKLDEVRMSWQTSSMLGGDEFWLCRDSGVCWNIGHLGLLGAVRALCAF